MNIKVHPGICLSAIRLVYIDTINEVVMNSAWWYVILFKLHEWNNYLISELDTTNQSVESTDGR